jgi:RNA-dependent RNA polymerase
MGGSKGMLSVDHTLRGRVVRLRKSMVKFVDPNPNSIEIARAFDRPSRYYLNQQLIMLLEGLGVRYEVFKAYQDAAVRDAHKAATNLGTLARFLEKHGLGTSYRLPSVLLRLHKLGVPKLSGAFHHRMVEFAIHHCLRDVKQHARIPVPGGYVLAGVADVHRYLAPREIFVFLRCPDCRADVYLEGDTLVSRSPTIHPGDVITLKAIGKPPEDSLFIIEPLQNCIVFSVQGVSACFTLYDKSTDLSQVIAPYPAGSAAVILTGTPTTSGRRVTNATAPPNGATCATIRSFRKRTSHLRIMRRARSASWSTSARWRT